MLYLDECYDLVKEGIILEEVFDYLFFRYLDNGVPFDWDYVWHKKIKNKSSLFDRLKKLFKK